MSEETSEQTKKQKQILLRKREPQIVKFHRRLRGARWGAQSKGATQYLNAVHGSLRADLQEAPQVTELLRMKRETAPVFHGIPRLYLPGLSDLNFTISGQCAEEERIASRWTIRGTHSGELLGAPPTGREVTFTGVTLTLLEGEQVDLGEGFEVKPGKVLKEQWAWWVVEEWNYWDLPGLALQLREDRQAVGGRA